MSVKNNDSINQLATKGGAAVLVGKVLCQALICCGVPVAVVCVVVCIVVVPLFWLMISVGEE